MIWMLLDIETFRLYPATKIVFNKQNLVSCSIQSSNQSKHKDCTVIKPTSIKDGCQLCRSMMVYRIL